MQMSVIIDQDRDFVIGRDAFDRAVNGHAQADEAERDDNAPIQKAGPDDEQENSATHEQSRAKRKLGDDFIPKKAATSALQKGKDQARSS